MACPRNRASLDIGDKSQGVVETTGRTDREIDKYWCSVVTKEPVSDDLKVLVRADLKKAWHLSREVDFHDRRRLENLPIDYNRIVLEDTVGQLDAKKAEYLCNKATALYWLQSAQEPDCYGQRVFLSKIVYAAIYREWARCYDSKPNIEHGHFFANPVRITPTGPSTVGGVVDAHLSLCTQASGLINQAKGRGRHIVGLLPLYYAIVLIIDRVESLDKYRGRSPRGFLRLDEYAQVRTVLVARTGVEDGLSAPISLESLKPHSFTLARSDVVTQYIDVVRVSLAVAVRFIVELEVKEKLATPVPKDELPLDTTLHPYLPKGVEGGGQVCCSPEVWADAHLVAAEEQGYDNIPETWDSIRRVQAALIGETFSEIRPFPWSFHWR